jgi:hypothetical protein
MSSDSSGGITELRREIRAAWRLGIGKEEDGKGEGAWGSYRGGLEEYLLKK